MEGNSDTCCNMDEPWRHYAKWNMPDTKGQILYGSTFMSSQIHLERMYLLPMNCTLKKGWNGKFYVVNILPQLKEKINVA